MPRRTFRPSQQTIERLENVARARQGDKAKELNLTAALNWSIFLADAIREAAIGGHLDRIAAHLVIATGRAFTTGEAAAFAVHYVEELMRSGKLSQGEMKAIWEGKVKP